MEAIARRPGVSGVYLRGARARIDAAIVVLVPQLGTKSAARVTNTFAPTVEGLRVDLLGVGELRSHALDHGDPLHARDTSARQGSLAAIAVASGRVRGLTAGHVVLPPARPGHLTRTYPYAGGPDEVWADAVDKSAPREAILVQGRFGGATDWALLTFAADPDQVDLEHQATHTRAPFIVRARELQAGGTARHHSTTRGHAVVGEIDGHSPVTLRLRVDDVAEEYTGVVVVRGLEGDLFSLPGDSGSLVVDADHAAWGIVLGASAQENLAFVLTLPPMIDQLGADAPTFFSRSP